MNVDADVAHQLEVAHHELAAARAEASAAQTDLANAQADLTAAQDDLAESRVELARRIRVEAALREIATRLTALRDPAEVLQRAVDAAAALLAADGARIDLLDERDGALYWGYDATTGNRPGLGPIEGEGAAEPGEGISGRAFVLRRSVWTGDYLKDDRFTHAAAPDGFADSHAIRSALATPIISEGAVLGTLTVYSDQRDAYGPPEAELIGILADQASLAITNARLIERLNRTSDDLARQAEVERALREITAEISAVADPETILHRIAEEGARLLRTERVFINLLNDPTGAEGWTWYSADEVGRDPWPADEAIRLGEGITGKAIAERRPFITGDYLADGRFVHRPGPDRYTAELGLPSALAVPVFDGETPLGVLLAESRVPDAFSDVDAERLQVLARQAGIALSNARLLDRLRRSEHQLRESEARYRYLVTASPDVVWEIDLEGRFTFVSDVVERLTGRAPQEVVGQDFSLLFRPETAADAQAQWTALVAAPADVSVSRLLLAHRDGSQLAVESFATGLFRDAALVGFHGAARDLSERNRLERGLSQQAAELAASAERAHLARELHDSVTQALFAMTLVTRSIELLQPRDPTAAAEQFAQLRSLQREALAEMRSLIFELQPGSIERDGLAQALRTHVTALESRVGLPIVLELEVGGRLPLEVEETLYRIAQEALHNVVRHASAKQARLRVRHGDGWARLLVEDDGHGFDPAQVPAGHLGVAGMHARAERLGGTLHIHSRPGSGTRVEAALPLA